MPQPTLSACMIVRNEAENLERCLRSIRPAVDELMIVDTGSTDSTVSIAERYADRVDRIAWEDNFSKARNHSISFASGEWILYIDGDEELVPGDGEKLRETLQRTPPEVDHLLLTIRNLDGTGGILSEFPALRIFRNHRGIRFEGIVHNQVIARGAGRQIPVTFLHYGYALSPEKMEAKFQRTLALTRQQIASDPENPFYYHNLALSLVNHNEFQEAVEAGLTGLELFTKKPRPFPPAFYNLVFLTGKGALGAGPPELAAGVCREGLKACPYHPDLLWILTMSMYELEQYEETLAYGKQFRETLQAYRNGTETDLPANTVGRAAPLFATAGYAAAHLGRDDIARALFEEALGEADWKVDFALKLLHFCKDHDHREPGRKILSRLRSRYPDDPRITFFSETFRTSFCPDPLDPEKIGEEEELSLRKIRNSIEADALPLNRENALLLILESLQRESRGDRSW